jgi:hypothetical protein
MASPLCGWYNRSTGVGMTYRGRIQNGVVVLEQGADLPEGIEVEVQPATVEEDRDTKSIQEMLLKFAGTVNDMPSDFAQNHDHYVHGTPKK